MYVSSTEAVDTVAQAAVRTQYVQYTLSHVSLVTLLIEYEQQLDGEMNCSMWISFIDAATELHRNSPIDRVELSRYNCSTLHGNIANTSRINPVRWLLSTAWR